VKILLLALLLATGASAQSGLSFFIDNSNGVTPSSQLLPLPSTYLFPDTSVGQTASIIVRVVNLSTTSQVALNAIYVGLTAGSSTANNNFAITGLENAIIAPQKFKLFYLSFTPTAAGHASGYLQVSVAGQQPAAVATLSGNGLSSSVSLTCLDSLTSQCDGKTPLQANSFTNFGSPNGVSLGTTYPIPFTLTNNTSAGIPAPTIASTLYLVAPFNSPDLANLPATIAPGKTVTFTIVFTPQPTLGPSGPENATLTVGSASYTLQGNVLIVNGSRPPNITYVYSGTGKPCQNCSAYTINVGPLPDTLTMLFTVANTEISGTQYADITLSAPPTVSGAGFTMSPATLVQSGTTSPGTCTGQPLTIHPGCSLTFQVTFAGSTSSTGTLPITYITGATTGTVTYTFNAQAPTPVGSAQSDLPGLALMCGASPCTSQTFGSQQQVQATLQVSAATTALVPLSIKFTSSVPGVTGDPAVTFISPANASNIGPISFTPSSLTGTLSNGQSQFTFQTGTTAGTITITATDPATLQPYAFTLPVLPSKVQITSSTAVRQNPNLVVTITGYDNTHSVGPLSFTFNDIAGKLLTPSAIPVDATSAFKQYFSTNTQAGGAFVLQVTFPVAGDVKQVGSVTANLSNSAGQASVSQTFQ